jgi:hypothetical protein
MRIINLYTGANTSTNAAVTYQWLQKTRMDTIFYSIHQLTAATALNSAYELSIQSTSQNAVNDPVGSICFIHAAARATTLGEVTHGLITPIGWQWQPIDRLYIHLIVGVAATSHAANFTLICNP